MTSDQENKPTKLTLGSTKLSLNRPNDADNRQKIVVTSRLNTVVEVRKSKIGLSLNKTAITTNKDTNSNNEEFNKRLNLLKNAAAEAKISSPQLSTLSKIAAMNQPALKPAALGSTEVEGQLAQNPDAPVKQDESTSSPQVIKDEQLSTDKILPAKVVSFEDEEIKKKTHDNKVLLPKSKFEDPKRLKKADIVNLLEDDERDGPKKRSLASIKRAREKEKRKHQEQQKQEKVYREVVLPEVITVGDLANRMSERGTDIIRELMKLGIMASLSQVIDADTAEIIVATFGHTSKRVQESDVENILMFEVDAEEDLQPRAPIVTVMGHVDHGKTSLLDALKATDVAGSEVGGITQHIGAYRVNLPNGKAITFIDTPGHEAFTEMRSRGAEITDIVVLVVAADDGVKAQTVEAIRHVKAANVPIIVAVNKIDKPGINIDRVKNELLQYELVAEELGGDVMIVPVSALQRTNLDKLEEAILLLAEMQELKANPDTSASGVIIEARIDKGKGVIATILVQRGTLKNGDIIIAGSSYGKVKRIINDKAIIMPSLGPSDTAEIHGLNSAPQAGDPFNVVQNEKQARNITEYRERKAKEKKISVVRKTSLEDLFFNHKGSKELAVIIKGDVQGSIEAIIGSLMKLPALEIQIKVLHHAVGAINESDLALAKASNAIIIGFNVRANSNAASIAERDKVDIRYYSIIYNLIDDIVEIMNGMLTPIIREKYIGSVEIRQIFNITKIGKIAGSYVTKGIIKRGAGVRLLREDIVIHEGKLKTLKRFKEDVKEVKESFECGIAFENYEDIKIGDVVEVFELIEEKKQLT